MRRLRPFVASALLVLAIAAPAAARTTRAAPSWAYDALVGPNPATSPAYCPASGTTGNAKTYTDNLALRGTGDQEPAIESAVTHVESHGGGIVDLPSGTWTIDSGVNVESNVTLEGQGEGATVLKAGSTFLNSHGPFGGFPMVYANGASNVTVEGLTLDQQGQTLNAVNASGRTNEMIAEDAYSTNVLIYNVETEDPFSYSIGELSAQQFCFSGDTTQVNTSGHYTQLDGIHLTDGSAGDVTNDYADQCNGTDGDDAIALQAWGGSVSGIEIGQNTACSGSTAALKLAETESGDSISDVQADGNLFEHSPGGIYTGYYPNGGSISNVDIDYNAFSAIGPGNDVDIVAPSGGSVTNTAVEYNCGGTSWVLASGSGNVNTGNKASC